MPSPEQEQLKKLIRHLKRGKGLRQLAREMKVVHSTIVRWQKGEGSLSGDGKIKLASYLGVSVPQLTQYLDGECSIKDLMGVSELSQVAEGEPLTLERVINWFRTLTLPDLMRLLHELAGLVMELTRPKETTIAQLVGAWELQELHEVLDQAISVERLQEIRDGDRPGDEELIDLAMVLVKDDGEAWTTHELMEIRDRTFGHHTHEERQANGK